MPGRPLRFCRQHILHMGILLLSSTERREKLQLIQATVGAVLLLGHHNPADSEILEASCWESVWILW